MTQVNLRVLIRLSRCS